MVKSGLLVCDLYKQNAKKEEKKNAHTQTYTEMEEEDEYDEDLADFIEEDEGPQHEWKNELSRIVPKKYLNEINEKNKNKTNR
jgi:hypothetical protein